MDTAVIKKLKKLLALARRGGTEAEGRTAMEKVQELLSKHSLSLADIDAPDDPLIVATLSALKDYKKILLLAAGRLCMAQLFCSKTHVKQIYLVGLKSNVDAAILLNGYLNQSLSRLIKDQPSDAHFRKSFRNAFAARIAIRVDQLIDQATNKTVIQESTGKELIIGSIYDTAFEEINRHFKTEGEQGITLGADGYGGLHGDAAARTVNLSKQIEQSPEGAR